MRTVSTSLGGARRAADLVVRHIKHLVLEGRVADGQRLASEKELARQFGVSRVTVRDALRTLEAQGFVEVLPGSRGEVYVSTPGLEHATESLRNLLRLRTASFQALAEARLALEPEVAALAARRRTQEDLDRLQEAVLAAHAAVAEGRPYSPPLSLGFHAALARATHNPFLVCAVDSFRSLFEEALTRLHPDPRMARRAADDHQGIAEAVRRRDAHTARERMRSHIRYFVGRVRKLDERGAWGWKTPNRHSP